MKTDRKISIKKAWKLILATALTLFATSAFCETVSDSDPLSVFQLALANGRAQMPLQDAPQLAKAIPIIQAGTGNKGPLVLYAARIARFAEQPRCGRVAFAIGQPAINRLFSDMGGQLNICDDGSPPLMLCPKQADRLVLANARCKDGSAPVNTPEIQASISTAVQSGSFLPDSTAGAAMLKAPFKVQK